MKPLEQFEVWFITGSQSLYGDDVLRQVAENSAAIAAGLDAAEDIPVRIVTQPVVSTPEAIEDVCRRANSSPGCVGVMTWMHTFSPAKMWIAGLTALDKPLLHLHTQFNRDLPWAEIDMDFMNLNQAAHGDREFAFMLSRLRVSRKIAVGHWQDASVAARIGKWARAACGWHELRHLKVARFGSNMRGVAVTDGDRLEAQVKMGVAVDGFGVNDLEVAMGHVDQSSIDALIDGYEEQYQMAPELARGGDRHKSLIEAAQIEQGLRNFLEEGGFGAFTDTFEDLAGLPQLPGIAVQRLMADGYGFGAEGDWKTACLVRVMKVMGAGGDRGASFMEEYTYHLGDSGPKVLGAHMLEVCPSIAGETPSCEIHPLSIGGKPDPVRLVFTARPGPAVIAGLIDLGTRFRLVVNEVELTEPDEPLPNLPVARAVWTPLPDFETAASAWLLAGGSHHTCLSLDLDLEIVRDFASMAGIELAAVDRDTSFDEFEKELRWNQAYHHLVTGP
jgi:L-arabinose isomerase